MKKQVGNKLRGSAGFTLVELIVVIAILGILAGIGTVGYSGYIKKAHQAADIQLAGDVNYALQLYGASNPGLAANQRKGARLGYVLLTEGAPEVSDAAMEEALKNMFGADYADALKLSYDNWTPEMLSAAAGGAAESVTNSSYVTGAGTDKLLGDVQKCTTGLSGFLQKFTTEGSRPAVEVVAAFFGSDENNNVFKQTLKKAGYTADDDYAGVTTDVLSNTTVFAVANKIKNDTDLQDKIETGNLLRKKMTQYYQDGEANILVTAAAWYASMEGLVSYLGNEDLQNTFNNIQLNGSTPEAICAQMDTAYNALWDAIDADNALGERYGAYYGNEENGKTQALTDAEALLSIMNTVDNVSDQYANAENLEDPSLMTSTGISGQLNNYVTGAEISESLAGKFDGSSGIVYLLADGKGGVTGSVDMVDKRA